MRKLTRRITTQSNPVLHHLRIIGVTFVALFLNGCAAPSSAVATLSPTAQTTGWETLAPGLERRTYAPNNGLFNQLIVVRIDPVRYTFRAHYRPADPLFQRGWQDELPDALVFVNANFFDRENRILGLLVSDGIQHGRSYVNRGGTFALQNGLARVRSNIAEPYAGEAFEQAVQGFPMLVLNGQRSFNDQRADRATRRTVVAQDEYGRILLMVTPLSGLTLLDLASYLPTTDMGIVNALNLDGGGSSMLSVRVQRTMPQAVASFDPVPAVLAVYPR